VSKNYQSIFFFSKVQYVKSHQLRFLQLRCIAIAISKAHSFRLFSLIFMPLPTQSPAALYFQSFRASMHV